MQPGDLYVVYEPPSSDPTSRWRQGGVTVGLNDVMLCLGCSSERPGFAFLTSTGFMWWSGTPLRSIRLLREVGIDDP
jgi:hypothetical protein